MVSLNIVRCPWAPTMSLTTSSCLDLQAYVFVGLTLPESDAAFEKYAPKDKMKDLHNLDDEIYEVRHLISSSCEYYH